MKKEQKHFSFPSIFIILMLLPSLPVSCSHHAPVIYPAFRDTTTEKFNHITVQDTTGRVYIGAVNRIYQLTEDLNLEATAVMGPEDDSPKCPVTRVCPGETKVSTDYYNKAVLIDSSQNKLLACGSLFQGACSLHDLDNVSTYTLAANLSVVANNDTASTVAFISPAPDTSDQPHVLYVGVSYTGTGPYSSSVPAVSSRSLDPSNMLTVTVPYSEHTLGTKMFVNSLFREVYPITYVYGFSSEGFSYFVTVQKQSQSYTSSGPFISKLVRICQNDVNYYSYTEVPFSCKASDGTDYNLAQAAYVERPGYELARHLQSPDKDALFVVFAKSENGDNKPNPDSALCVYSMFDVRRMFTQNIQHCYDGNGKTSLEYINPSISCYPVQLKIEDDFCGLDVNTPLGGAIPIEATPVLRFPGVLLTAVAATSTYDYTVIFLGTSAGHLKKAVIQKEDVASEYGDIVIEEGSPVNPDLVFDKTKDHIYVMTQSMVKKVGVEECERFHSCSDCLGAGDPYCGWCSLENRCLTKKGCVETSRDSVFLSSFKSSRCITSADGTVTFNETAGTADRTATHPGQPRSPIVEQSKLATLQDIAQSMRNIDMSLRELIDLQKQKN